MSKINLYPDMNKKIADLLLDCDDNGMMLYAGTYIKELEKQLAEYKEVERQGHIMRMPIEAKTAIYSIEYCCSLNENNKMGMCHKGLCSKCEDRKTYILETTVEASCKIKELGESVFFDIKSAKIAMERMGEHD